MTTLRFASLDFLTIDNAELDGSHGMNRAPVNPSESIANDDLSAAKAFLREYQATPTTQRNYTKEIERLILWSIFVQAKPLSSLSSLDLKEFVAFLADPQPVEQWATKRKFPRDSLEWKPFTARLIPADKQGGESKLFAGLAASSRLVAMASLSSFFGWLVDSGYLIKNPMRQIKTTRKAIRAENPIQGKAKVSRYLDDEMWAAFQDAIEMLPKESADDLERYERAKFIAALILFLAPRASELANGKMSDFKLEGKKWWWHVVGKGSKAAQIPVVDGMKEALIRYRTHLGLPTPLPLDDDDTPLLRSLKDGSRITDRHLNTILDGLFEAAAKLLEQKAAELPVSALVEKAEYQTRAGKIRQASAHWGRHTSITFQIRSGIPRSIVQLTARHSDARTTDKYTHEDADHWHNEAQKLHA